MHVEVMGAACVPSPSARSPARACRGPESTTRAAVRGGKWHEDRRAGRNLEARGGRARRKPTAHPRRRADPWWPDSAVGKLGRQGADTCKSGDLRAARTSLSSEVKAALSPVAVRKAHSPSSIQRRGCVRAHLSGAAAQPSPATQRCAELPTLGGRRSACAHRHDGKAGCGLVTCGTPRRTQASAKRARRAHMEKIHSAREGKRSLDSHVRSMLSRGLGGYVKKHDFHFPPRLRPRGAMC